MMANFDIHIFIIARENSCKIDRAPYGVRLISYNAGRAPYDVVRASADVFIYRRRPAPVRYVTTQKKILKNRPVPGRLSYSPVMCKSLKSYDVSFICDRSITKVLLLKLLAGIDNLCIKKCINYLPFNKNALFWSKIYTLKWKHVRVILINVNISVIIVC